MKESARKMLKASYIVLGFGVFSVVIGVILILASMGGAGTFAAGIASVASGILLHIAYCVFQSIALYMNGQ